MKSKCFYFSLIFLFVFVFASKNASAQQKSFSFSLSHPVIIGDTFFSNYSGIAGLDIGYAYPIKNSFSVGGKLGYSRSKFSFPLFQGGNATTFSNLFRGQIFMSTTVGILDQFSVVPQLGLGYAFVEFSSDFQNLSRSGINPAFSLLFNFSISSHLDLSLFSSYELIYLGKPDNALDTPYNKEMHYINIGAKFLMNL